MIEQRPSRLGRISYHQTELALKHGDVSNSVNLWESKYQSVKDRTSLTNMIICLVGTSCLQVQTMILYEKQSYVCFLVDNTNAHMNNFTC